MRTQQSFSRLSDAHRSSLGEGRGDEKPNRNNQGAPEEKEVRTTSGSHDDLDEYGNNSPAYCKVDMLNTSNSVVEIGKNVKIGEADTFESNGNEETPVGGYVTPKQCATRATREYG